MHKVLNNLIIFNGYPLAVVVAISMHVALILTLVLLQGNNHAEALELVQPTVVKALFIDENPQVRNERLIEQRRIQRAEEQRQAEAARRREAEEAARREAAAEAERQRQAEEQRQAAIREQQARQRQQAEQARQEQERQQREQQLREAEQRRQRELAEAERRQREAEAERARQQAAAEAAAAEAARNEFELVQSATGLIQQLVQDHWSRPPSARNGMRAVIQIRMLPTGELIDATITQSSGDPAFDRSAENAVYRAAPFSELQDLPINVFNNNFRSLSLIFEPQDLLN
jgi:colicin import membrane protein